MALRLTTRFGHPTFVDLPWEEPLAEWTDPRLVTPVEGLHRHVVKFIAYGGALYAIKELPEDLATIEYELLRELDHRSAPVVEAVGTVTGRTDRDDEPLDSVLITRHLDYSLPYRNLFQNGTRQELWPALLDSLALLLVRIHLVGFFWGDCSLSNALFRRDAGALSATLVDAETGELHPTLSVGQRKHDLLLAETNVAGELLDIAAAGGWAEDVDPSLIGRDLVRRYEGLWSELTTVEFIKADDLRAVEQRVRRLNDLGFDVSEIVIEGAEDEATLRLRPVVFESGHHNRELQALTGLDVQENQARRLLNDIRRYKAWLERSDDGSRGTLTDQLAAMRWYAEVFAPTIDGIPPEARRKLEPAEHFHRILEHRWLLSERAGREVGTAAARDDYVANVLHYLPDEKQVLLAAAGAEQAAT
jgi:Domain of unknown function (DUF4032)/Lipopolysaccharide kinase (Kdo/WaaP) family